MPSGGVPDTLLCQRFQYACVCCCCNCKGKIKANNIQTNWKQNVKRRIKTLFLKVGYRQILVKQAEWLLSAFVAKLLILHQVCAEIIEYCTNPVQFWL